MTKIELFAHNVGRLKSRHSPQEHCTYCVEQHSGGSIMFWDCFATNGTGELHKVDGKMKREDYQLRIL